MFLVAKKFKEDFSIGRSHAAILRQANYRIKEEANEQWKKWLGKEIRMKSSYWRNLSGSTKSKVDGTFLSFVLHQPT